MTTPTPTFVLGAGFLGRHIIDILLTAHFPVTILVRDAELGAILEKQGARIVIGSLSDLDLIATQSAEHSMIINASSSDDLPSIEAIISGMRERVLRHQPTTLIHTSGAGMFMDDAKGQYKSDKIYRDDNPRDIDNLPPTALHRNVDLAILQAAREFGEKARMAIFIPPVIYGFNPTHQRLSMALPKLVKFALKRGYAGRVNEGLNVWSAVHVVDLARAYTTLIDNLESLGPAALLENPYFFADDGYDFSWGEAAGHVGRILYKLGRIPSPETRPVDPVHYGDFFGPMTEKVAGGNARTRGVRMKELGWTPKEKSIWASLEDDEIPYILWTRG